MFIESAREEGAVFIPDEESFNSLDHSGKRRFILEDFMPIIKSIAFRGQTNNIFTRDDLRQELILKVLEDLIPILWNFADDGWDIFRRIEVEEKEAETVGRSPKHVDPINVFAWVRRCLLNRANDLTGYYIKRVDTSVNTPRVEDILSNQSSEFTDVLHCKQRFSAPDANVDWNDFKKALVNSVKEIKSKDPELGELVKYYLESHFKYSFGKDDTVRNSMVKKSPRLSGKEFIPPFTLATYIGMTPKEVYKVNIALTYQLNKRGYTWYRYQKCIKDMK